MVKHQTTLTIREAAKRRSDATPQGAPAVLDLPRLSALRATLKPGQKPDSLTLVAPLSSKTQAAVARAMETMRLRLDQAAHGVAVVTGSVGASLRGTNNLKVDKLAGVTILLSRLEHGRLGPAQGN